MNHHRQVEFLREVQLALEDLMLALFIGGVIMVVQAYLANRHYLVAVLTDSPFDDGPLFLPVRFEDILRMETEGRKTVTLMPAAHIEYSFYGSGIDAGYYHRLDACFALPRNDFFAVRRIGFFVQMNMRINHWCMVYGLRFTVEDARVAVGEEAEVMAQGVVIDGLPVAADERRDEEQ